MRHTRIDPACFAMRGKRKVAPPPGLATLFLLEVDPAALENLSREDATETVAIIDHFTNRL